MFERVSVAKDFESRAEALRHGRGRMDLPELKSAFRSEVASGAMLAARGEIATKENLKCERRMVVTINEGVDKHQALGRSRQHGLGSV